MNRPILVVVLSMTLVAGLAQVKKPATAAKAPAAKPAVAVNPLKTNIDSVSYSVGTRMAQSLKAQGFEKINLSIVEKAMRDVMQGNKSLIADELINACLGSYQQKASAEKVSGVKKEGQAYMAANAKRPGVTTLPDGLQYEVMRSGTSTEKPLLTSKVKVHYHGTLINGTVFDSSVDKGAPITYPVTGFIRGWQEILPMMTVGSKWKIWVPSDLGYGDSGGPSPGGVLIFEMELLGVEN